MTKHRNMTKHKDPIQVYSYGKDSFQQGRYEDAKDAYLWFWENALDIDGTLYGVRASYFLTSFIELSEVHPPSLLSLQKLIKKTRHTLNTKPNEKAFDDFRLLTTSNNNDDDFIEITCKLIDEGWDHDCLRSQSTLVKLCRHNCRVHICKLYPKPHSWLQSELDSLKEFEDEASIQAHNLPDDISYSDVEQMIAEDKENLDKTLSLILPFFAQEDYINWSKLHNQINHLNWIIASRNTIKKLSSIMPPDHISRLFY